jgi:hypothetical protein
MARCDDDRLRSAVDAARGVPVVDPLVEQTVPCRRERRPAARGTRAACGARLGR